MRRGFTMIELIFVIVIIGILAAVAIPKLSATRSDAKATKTVANMRTLLEDIQNYYTANGEDTTVNPNAWTAVTYDVVTKAIPSNIAQGITTGAGAQLDIRETEGAAGKICFTINERTQDITINGRSVTQRYMEVVDGVDITTQQCQAAAFLAEDKGLHRMGATEKVVFAGQSVAY